MQSGEVTTAYRHGARPVDDPGVGARQARRDLIGCCRAARSLDLNNVRVFARCLGIKLGEAPRRVFPMADGVDLFHLRGRVC